MSLAETLTAQRNKLLGEVDARFDALMREAENQFIDAQNLHTSRIDAYTAERDALKAAITETFGSGDTS